MSSFAVAAKRVSLACVSIALISAVFSFSQELLQPLQIHTRHIQKVVLEKWLQQNHIFIPASSDAMEFVGRWSPGAHGSRRDASFHGSGVSFNIRNSTSILLSFGNIERRVHGSNTDSYHNHKRHLAVCPDSKQQEHANPSTVLLTINDRATLFNGTSQGFLRIEYSLSYNVSYHVTLKHLGGVTDRDGTTEFEGIWLSKGGELVPLEANPKHLGEKTLEVYGSLSTIPGNWHTPINESRDLVDAFTFSNLLENNMLYNTTTVTLSAPPFLCLTSKCCTMLQNCLHIFTVQDLYFRSGPVNTYQFKRPWTYSTEYPTPTLLLLELGYWDFFTFLSDPAHRNAQSVDTFIAQFVDAYVKFILTIRRIPSQARNSTSVQNNDASFIYNSQPSAMPIFLMLPPLPSAHDHVIRTSLFNALHKIVTSLQRVEGDTKTFLVDTSGWLDNNDFFNSSLDDSYHSNSTTLLTGEPVSIVVPVPTRHGQVKIANHLALHLCPYLHPDAGFEQGTRVCPFDGYGYYLGNLYVPDESTMAKLVQERKIEKVKSVFSPASNLVKS